MKLNFAALARPTAAPTVCQPWGQAGTVGTPASMRLCTSPGAKAGPGASGDRLVQCPPSSPRSPHGGVGDATNEINVSPISPPVPNAVGLDERGEDFAGEAFEERAAIMEFDGGLTRIQAEEAAREFLGMTS